MTYLNCLSKNQLTSSLVKQAHTHTCTYAARQVPPAQYTHVLPTHTHTHTMTYKSTGHSVVQTTLPIASRQHTQAHMCVCTYLQGHTHSIHISCRPYDHSESSYHSNLRLCVLKKHQRETGISGKGYFFDDML